MLLKLSSKGLHVHKFLDPVKKKFSRISSYLLCFCLHFPYLLDLMRGTYKRRALAPSDFFFDRVAWCYGVSSFINDVINFLTYFFIFPSSSLVITYHFIKSSFFDNQPPPFMTSTSFMNADYLHTVIPYFPAIQSDDMCCKCEGSYINHVVS